MSDKEPLTASQQILLDDEERSAVAERQRAKKRKRIADTVNGLDNALQDTCSPATCEKVNRGAQLAIELTGDLHADITDTKHNVKALRGDVLILTDAVRSNGHGNGTIKIPIRKEAPPLELPSWVAVAIVLIVLVWSGWMASKGLLGDFAKAWSEVRAIREGASEVTTPKTPDE